MHSIFNPQKTQKNISRVLGKRIKNVRTIVAVCGIVFIIFVFWFGDYGLNQYYQLWREEKSLQSELEQLELESLNLKEEMQLLKQQDPEYLQRIARENFGLVKPGETIYQLSPVNKNNN